MYFGCLNLFKIWQFSLYEWKEWGEVTVKMLAVRGAYNACAKVCDQRNGNLRFGNIARSVAKLSKNSLITQVVKNLRYAALNGLVD